MSTEKKRKPIWVCFGLVMLLLAIPVLSMAESAAEIDQEVDIALEKLYQTTPAAKKIASQAVGILVFPDIIKGGFIIGGQYGDGALRENGMTTGYYRSIAASFGLQAGAQTFGYALFFLTEDDLAYLKRSDGWEIGVGPTIVVVDKGVASAMTSTTLKSGVYAFFFDQKGLMAGLGLQGSKITQIVPDK